MMENLAGSIDKPCWECKYSKYNNKGIPCSVSNPNRFWSCTLNNDNWEACLETIQSNEEFLQELSQKYKLELKQSIKNNKILKGKIKRIEELLEGQE